MGDYANDLGEFSSELIAAGFMHFDVEILQTKISCFVYSVVIKL